MAEPDPLGDQVDELVGRGRLAQLASHGLEGRLRERHGDQPQSALLPCCPPEALAGVVQQVGGHPRRAAVAGVASDALKRRLDDGG